MTVIALKIMLALCGSIYGNSTSIDYKLTSEKIAVLSSFAKVI